VINALSVSAMTPVNQEFLILYNGIFKLTHFYKNAVVDLNLQKRSDDGVEPTLDFSYKIVGGEWRSWYKRGTQIVQ